MLAGALSKGFSYREMRTMRNAFITEARHSEPQDLARSYANAIQEGRGFQEGPHGGETGSGMGTGETGPGMGDSGGSGGPGSGSGGSGGSGSGSGGSGSGGSGGSGSGSGGSGGSGSGKGRQ